MSTRIDCSCGSTCRAIFPSTRSSTRRRRHKQMMYTPSCPAWLRCFIFSPWKSHTATVCTLPQAGSVLHSAPRFELVLFMAHGFLHRWSVILVQCILMVSETGLAKVKCCSGKKYDFRHVSVHHHVLWYVTSCLPKKCYLQNQAHVKKWYGLWTELTSTNSITFTECKTTWGQNGPYWVQNHTSASIGFTMKDETKTFPITHGQNVIASEKHVYSSYLLQSLL